MNKYGTNLRIYDNAKFADRYTILPPRWAKDYHAHEPFHGEFIAIGCNDEPFHPQGIGYHTTCAAGKHLGSRISWDDLPEDAQTFAAQSFPEYVQS